MNLLRCLAGQGFHEQNVRHRMVIHIENHSLENARRRPVVKRQNDRAKCPSPCASREIRLNGSLGFLQMDIGLAELQKTKEEERR
jgi:hypothetical protein